MSSSIIIFSISVLILLLTTTNFIYHYIKYNQCRLYPNYKCYNDYKCDTNDIAEKLYCNKDIYICINNPNEPGCKCNSYDGTIPSTCKCQWLNKGPCGEKYCNGEPVEYCY